MSLNKLRKLRKKSQLRKSENASKIKVLSLFSGAGGGEMGFDDRFKVVGFSEINKDAINVLDLHWPEVKNYGDITKLEPRKLPDHDLLIGGSPCTSFSLAGQRAGLEGESGLFFNFVEVLKAKKPTYFIWENVKGTFSSEEGWDFAVIQIELAEAGYDFRWNVVNAKDVGIPQSRERIFIVGTLRDRSSKEVFFEARDGEENTIEPESKGEYGNEDKEGVIGRDYSYCIDSNYYKGANANHKNKRQLVAYSKSTRDHHVDHRIRLDGSANTLSTGEGCRSQSTENLVVDESGEDILVRRLTPLECERIMGWPDNHTKYGKIGETKYEISDSQRYQMCGNGIVSRCVKLMITNLFGENNGRD